MATHEFHRHFGITPNWAPATLALTGLLLMLEYRLLAVDGRLRQKKLSFFALGGTLALAAVSLNAPGIIGALFVLATGFHRGNRIITGLAVAFMAVFLSAYYYNMEITLLSKSYVLLASGAILLLLRPLLIKAIEYGQEVIHE
jgi:uncharacterized membrane protein